MKLVSDIINELMDPEKSLAGPLMKTKVLATRVKNDELLNWSEHELAGYTTDDELPEYRCYVGHLTGTYTNGTNFTGITRYSNVPLPVAGLSGKVIENLTAIEFHHSVESLEYMKSKQGSGGMVEKALTAEALAIITKQMRKYNPMMTVIHGTCTMSQDVITQTLSVIRNKLLTFMLKLEEEFGTITEFSDLKEKNPQIKQIMQQTINVNGDGNFLNTGNNNEIENKVTIKKDNPESLKSFLLENQVSEEDAAEICQLVVTEEPDHENNRFGPRVNQWIQKMMGKALEGSWAIAAGAAGNLLADAIKVYYGI